MKISRITPQEKRKDRYSIFIDGKYAFSLSESALLDSTLTSGQELTVQELRQWKRHSADDKIYTNALRFATIRPRSQWEMERYLDRKAASPTLSQSILTKLTSIGLLDDAQFARSWVANRRLLRSTSKLKLRQELRAKHVEHETIDAVLEEDAGNEQIILRELVSKKRQLPKYRTDKKKFMQYLARQGFSYGDIKEVLEIEEP